eukprot:1023578-Pyramimonas_sp.AAC.1
MIASGQLISAEVSSVSSRNLKSDGHVRGGRTPSSRVRVKPCARAPNQLSLYSQWPKQAALPQGMLSRNVPVKGLLTSAFQPTRSIKGLLASRKAHDDRLTRAYSGSGNPENDPSSTDIVFLEEEDR